jgi:hypothetical protein
MIEDGSGVVVDSGVEIEVNPAVSTTCGARVNVARG